MSQILIKKRSGVMEPLDDEKYHQHVEEAVKGIKGVSASQIEMDAAMNIVDGMRSTEIQHALIMSASNKIPTDPRYNKPAARLLNQDLRKRVYGDYKPDDFVKHIVGNIENGVYDKSYLEENYTDDEFKELLSIIDYDKDDKFTYSGLKKNTDGYLIKRYGEIKETPQESYIMIAIFAFAKYKEKYDVETRAYWVKELYTALSDFEISLPTPIMGKLRTTFRNFISCVLIPLGDTKRSIANAFSTILTVVASGAGIGLGGYDIRGQGADIDDGRMQHVGTFPIIKASEKTTKAFVQPDRDGSTTVFYAFYNVEILKMMTWGNAKGTDDTRARDLDHAINFNKLFFERLRDGKDITLFFTNDVPMLKTCLGDFKTFKRFYEQYENTVPVERQTKVPAEVIFDNFIDERVLQSREYAAFMDAVQMHGGYDVPINQLNLCVVGSTEILTKEYGNIEIGKLVNDMGVTSTECWNGEEWSQTELFKTSDGQKVWTIILSNGVKLEVTPYHKWYVKKDPNKYDSPIIEKRTHELLIGDKLEKFLLPDDVKFGDKLILNPYTSGFFTSDGTDLGQNKRIRLYNEKTNLLDKLFKKIRYKRFFKANENNNSVIEVYYSSNYLEDKFFVPTSEYRKSDVLKWLAGVLDGDGTVLNNNGAMSIQLASVNEEYLTKIRLLLVNFGIDAKISVFNNERVVPLPTNKGDGSAKLYKCKKAWRITIPGNDVNTLIKHGIKLHRLDIRHHDYNRDARSFVTVKAIIDDGGISDTYCGTEPKRNKLLFNGVLTGNCNEIAQPTFPLESLYNIKRNIRFYTEEDMKHYYELRHQLFSLQSYENKFSYTIRKQMTRHFEFVNSDLGATVDETLPYDYFDLLGLPVMDETGVCIIAGINIGHVKVERLPIVSELLVRVLDELIDYNKYESSYMEKAAKMRRGIGIGFSDVFHLLAINEVKYNTKDGMELINERCELATYHMIKTSIQLAEDFGPCLLSYDNKYSKGIFPIDTYEKNVDELVSRSPLGLDWDGLKVRARKSGTRHSTLFANAPYGNSAIPSGSTSGIEPPRSLIYKKHGLYNVVPDYETHKDFYTTAWSDEFNNADYFKFTAVVQKWWDQALSLNEYRNLLKYVDGKIPKSELMRDILIAMHYGHKSMYYLNVKSKEKDKDGDGDDSLYKADIKEEIIIEDEDDSISCESGSCSI